MPGPPAKHPSVRRRRNEKASERTLRAPEHPQGPTLPDSYVLTSTEHGQVERQFGKDTRRWWNKLRRDPLASAYRSSHWEWLLWMARLVDRWLELGDMDAFKELRRQAKPFGLRPGDANSLDWTIDTAITGPVKTTKPEQGSRQVGDFRVYDGGEAEAS